MVLHTYTHKFLFVNKTFSIFRKGAHLFLFRFPKFSSQQQKCRNSGIIINTGVPLNRYEYRWFSEICWIIQWVNFLWAILTNLLSTFVRGHFSSTYIRSRYKLEELYKRNFKNWMQLRPISVWTIVQESINSLYLSYRSSKLRKKYLFLFFFFRSLRSIAFEALQIECIDC